MGEFAPVCPPRILEGLDRDGGIGMYHLLLAHDVAANPDDYRKVFSAYRPGLTVIMDNSIIELGDAVGCSVVQEAIGIVPSQIVVLPDVIRDGPATVERVKEALHTWPNTLGMNQQFMVVPQGKTIQEFIKCAQELAELKGAPNKHLITWWGIPRVFAQDFVSRAPAIAICQTLMPKRNVHLLGFSDRILDDVLCSQMPNVRGIDSTTPIRIASYGMEMQLDMPDLPRRGDWWDTAEYIPLMAKNFKTMREWVSVKR